MKTKYWIFIGFELAELCIGFGDARFKVQKIRTYRYLCDDDFVDYVEKRQRGKGKKGTCRTWNIWLDEFRRLDSVFSHMRTFSFQDGISDWISFILAEENMVVSLEGQILLNDESSICSQNWKWIFESFEKYIVINNIDGCNLN